MSTLLINPILHKIEPDRQGAKRHYGVHPYFTRRPFNVVRDYIKHYSSQGEKILDPFGGSGVTAIEAFLLSRTGIQNDINPLANFISDGLFQLSRYSQHKIQTTLVTIIDAISPRIKPILSKSEKEIEDNWKIYQDELSLPLNSKLPKNSDVDFYYDLFTRKQLITLAIIKSEIDKIKENGLKHISLLCWSATLGKINRTFISTKNRKESRGGSSIFSIYRYKIAESVVELNPLEVFINRAKNTLKAQKEIHNEIETQVRRNGVKGEYISTSINASELSKVYEDEIDYVFTDPPYGGHIAYLDLSTLWNLWLGITPKDTVYKNEIIVGGEQKHSEEFYIENLSKSIKSIAAAIKNEKYFSIVFQHKNVKYFETILDSSSDSNCELVAAISQETGTIWSMHKKKGKHTVLAGEMILTFKKSKNKLKINKSNNITFDKLLEKYLNGKNNELKITEEEIFNDLIVLCWQKNLMDELNFSELEIKNKLIEMGFHYESTNHIWKKHYQESQIKIF